MIERQADVLILGGGPCGSTAATLLAKQGIKPTIIEGETGPRFHVGESLLPGTMPLLERLGVMADVVALPHTMKKDGATFVTHDGAMMTEYWFDEAMAPAVPHAYQVRRDEFDWTLMKHAEKNGAELLLGWKAEDPIWEGDRLVGLKCRTPEGEEAIVRSKMFLDASGQMGFMSRKQKTRVPYPGHQKVAAVTHFKGAYRAPGRGGGNIIVAITEGGWFWMIPFGDGTTSVGVVCDISKWREVESGGPEALFNAAVERTPEVKRRLEGAERILPFNAVQNFSFGVSNLAGPGYCLIGDAAGFLDPVFSTGVFISTSVAAQAADDIAAAWSKPVIAAADMKRTTKRAKGLQKLFFSFIHSYYNPSFLALFFNPTNRYLRLQAAVTSLLAADVLGPKTWSRVWRFRVMQWLGRRQEAGWKLVKPLPATPA